MLGSIAGWYKRLRHSRGYGVHSPSAYRLVREVLCPDRKYRFYYEDELRSGAERQSRPEALCLIYRLLVYFEPQTVGMAGFDRSMKIWDVAEKACPNGVSENVAEFLIVNHCSRFDIPNHVPRVIFFLDNSNPMIEPVKSRITAGHIFHSPKRTLIINRSDLPLQTFELNF